jgi:hypothetical protein
MTFSEPAPPADPRAPRDAAIQARGLTRYFGRRSAVDGVSFRVPRGSVFALSAAMAPARPRPSA